MKEVNISSLSMKKSTTRSLKKTQGNQPSPKKQPPNNPALSLRQRLFGG